MTTQRQAEDYVRAFNRFELKYLITQRSANAFLAAIRPYVTADPNTGREGFYKVVSRYYDASDLRYYWEKMDGEKFRRKVRVRTYGEQPDSAFLEIKQRLNMSVQKRRTRLPLADAEATMRDILRGRRPQESEAVLDEIFFLVQAHRLNPTLIVSYNRAALFDRFKKDLRITLDRNIRCRQISLELDRHRLRGAFAIPPTHAVMEVKFNESIPKWLCNVLNRFDFQVERISKYCYGVERLGLDGCA